MYRLTNDTQYLRTWYDAPGKEEQKEVAWKEGEGRCDSEQRQRDDAMMKMKVRRCGEESKVMDNAVVNREAWNDAVAMRERLGTAWWRRVCVGMMLW